MRNRRDLTHTLKGASADLTLLDEEEGEFRLADGTGATLRTRKRLKTLAVIRVGKAVDLSDTPG